MKSKLLRDILIYVVVPILIFNVHMISSVETAFQIVSSIVIVYSIFTRVKEHRLNITGLFISFIIMIYILSSKNTNAENVYFYTTCIFLSLALITPCLTVFNKEVSVIVLRDILRSLNKNSLAVIRLLKKKSMMNEIRRITAMIETNLILVSLLRILNIVLYSGESSSYLNFITNFIGLIFSTVIIYRVVKVIYTSKKLNIYQIDKNFENEDNSKGKIINFNSFK